MEEKKIPNGWIIIGYYTSVFSIFPIFGVLFGFVGFFLALLGLYVMHNKSQQAGRWLGYFSLVVSALGSGLQSIVIYNILFSL